MKKGHKKKTGFAETKTYPHKNHPARYRRNGVNNDDIEYITTTHHEEVLLNGKLVNTIPLDNNINPKERKDLNQKSYVYPMVYVGKRSHLGKERNDLSLIGKDIEKVSKLFDTLPRETVRYQSNSKKKKK